MLNEFFCRFFGIFILNIMSSAKREIFISSFLICMPFIFLALLQCVELPVLCQIRDKSGYPYLALDLRRKLFNLLPVDTLAIGFYRFSLLKWGNFLLFLMSAGLSQIRFEKITALLNIIIKVFFLVCWYVGLYLLIFKCWTSLAYWNKSPWSYFFNTLLDSICSDFTEQFWF